jgi:AraC-like DNA-binding protein
MTEVFESTDLGSSEALLSEYYTSVKLSVPAAPHLIRLTQHQVGRVRLDRTTFHMDLDIDAEPFGAVCIGRIGWGRAAYGPGGDERRYQSGDVYLVAQPDEGFHTALRSYDAALALFDPALLGELADPAPGDGDAVRFLDHSPVSARAAAMWWSTYTFVRARSEACAPEAMSPLYEHEATRLLVAATLAAFPTNAVFEPTIEDRRDAHPHTVQRATEFIEANAAGVITIKDIAEASGVSTRAVQLSFRRHLDTTPTAYLRKVRLQYVHDGLVAASPDRTTVTVIAGRWGFSNFGRFASQYRAEFGELPGQTLRR